MAEPQPLLTIAIPTFSRSRYLRDLLEAVVPQVAANADVDLLVSDNASEDDTAEVIEPYRALLGRRLRMVRQPRNIGSDANFVFCFEEARGRYVWICGDDDILVPAHAGASGAIDSLLQHIRAREFDLVYATSFAFRDDWRAAPKADPMGRRFHVIDSAAQFTRVVNIMFTFISGMVVNKERFEELRRSDPSIEPPRNFVGTNLPQLSWTLPLLRQHRRSLVLWDRPVGGRRGNGHGYSLGTVFGRQLTATVERCLPDRRDLARILLNFTLRRWLPSTVFELRTARGSAAEMLAGSSALRESYGRNPRFWVFTWPVLRFPVSLARVALWVGAGVSKGLYALEVRGFWRREMDG